MSKGTNMILGGSVAALAVAASMAACGGCDGEKGDNRRDERNAVEQVEDAERAAEQRAATTAANVQATNTQRAAINRDVAARCHTASEIYKDSFGQNANTRQVIMHVRNVEAHCADVATDGQINAPDPTTLTYNSASDACQDFADRVMEICFETCTDGTTPTTVGLRNAIIDLCAEGEHAIRQP